MILILFMFVIIIKLHSPPRLAVAICGLCIPVKDINQINVVVVVVVVYYISINLLVFYHECRSLIGYATRYLFCDR